MQAGYQGWEVF